MRTYGMKKDRLLLLAAELEGVPPERFDLMEWAHGDGVCEDRIDCGSTACGIGHAATMPEFRELGLRLKRNVVGNWEPILEDSEGTERGFDAAAVLFGISFHDAQYLFLSDSTTGKTTGRLPPNATPKQLAEHIRKWVDRNSWI